MEVIKERLASDLRQDGLRIGDEWIQAQTILWAAGVKPASLTETIETPKDSQGRLMVESDLSLPGQAHIFAIGDQAHCSGRDGKPLPGIAPVAIQQGHFVGKLILNELKGKPRHQFLYFDKGIMATIGRSRAVVSTGGLNFSGWAAWIFWVLIHIVYLMRFKNRVFVFFQWVWAYFSFGRGARLIVHKTWRFYSSEKISYK